MKKANLEKFNIALLKTPFHKTGCCLLLLVRFPSECSVSGVMSPDVNSGGNWNVSLKRTCDFITIELAWHVFTFSFDTLKLAFTFIVFNA